jgi:heme oxygenase
MSASTASVSPLRQCLRQASKQAHHELDHHPLLTPLLRADLNRTHYGKALAALHGIQASSEQRIQAFLQQCPGWADYRLYCRLPALEADLAALGLQPVAAPSNWPEPTCAASLVGMLYVTEGSNMGGQVIARSIRQHGQDDLPMSFFSGQGEVSDQAWQDFWALANAQCSVDDYALAASTALAVFAAIKIHLDGCRASINATNSRALDA